MNRPTTYGTSRDESRAELQELKNPLADYDPGYLERQGLRGGSTTEAVYRGVPGGWPFCECGADVCPDREVPR